jgi:hypothetical protein
MVLQELGADHDGVMNAKSPGIYYRYFSLKITWTAQATLYIIGFPVLCSSSKL